MNTAIVDRLRLIADLIERIGIDQDRILSAEVVGIAMEESRMRLHVESSEFFAKVPGTYRREPHCGGERETVSQFIDGVKVFCVVDTQKQKSHESSQPSDASAMTHHLNGHTPPHLHQTSSSDETAARPVCV